MENTKKDLEKCKQEKQEYLEGWKRAKADLLNYKKNEQNRITEMVVQAQKEFILEILLVLDNIEIAEEKINKKNEWTQGFLNIKKQILSFLEKKDVKEIKTKGQVFDPYYHEAIEMIEGENSNTIAEEVKKGYLFNNKVLRPAKVKIIK